MAIYLSGLVWLKLSSTRCHVLFSSTNHFKLFTIITIDKYLQFQKHAESKIPWYGKGMGKNKHSKVISFLHLSQEAEIHTITKSLEK